MVYRETTATSTKTVPWQAHAIAFLIVLAAVAVILGTSATFFGALLWLVWSYVAVPAGMPPLLYWHACVVGLALAIVLGNLRAKTAGTILAAAREADRRGL